MNIGRQAASGAAWNYAAFLVSKGMLLVATIILAQVLSPNEIGLMSMALLVIVALDILRDFGIGAALIQRQGDLQPAANLTFWLNTIVGILLFGLNYFAAPLVVGFFKTDSPADAAMMVDMLRVLGLSILFLSLGATHDSLLQKNIDFRRRMIPEVGRTLIKGTLQVSLAVSGYGVWSLVIGQVVGEFIAVLLLWIVERWRPTMEFDRKLFRPMLKYSYHILMVNGLGTLISDIDYFIIGRWLGEAALGFYTMAYRIPEMAITYLSHAVSKVAFPIIARVQTDKEAVRQVYLDMQHYMLLILAPLGFGLFSVAPTLVHVLFGPEWEPMVHVMEVLTIYMVIGGIGHWPGVIYKAVGRPDLLNYLSLAKLVVLAPVLWWAATNYGILGVAWGQLAVRILAELLDMVVVSRFAQISVLSNLKIIWPPFAAALVMTAAVRGLFLFDGSGESLLFLLLAIPLGAVVYGAAIWLLDRAAVTELLTIGRGFLDRRTSSSETPTTPTASSEAPTASPAGGR